MQFRAYEKETLPGASNSLNRDDSYCLLLSVSNGVEASSVEHKQITFLLQLQRLLESTVYVEKLKQQCFLFIFPELYKNKE